LVFVTTQKNPLLEIACSFIFVRHRDIIYHHAFITLHVSIKYKTIWIKVYLKFCPYGFILNPSSYSYFKLKLKLYYLQI
jgi:hypothetical protein